MLETPVGGARTIWTLCSIPNKGRRAGYGSTGTGVSQEKRCTGGNVKMAEFWQNDLIVWKEGIRGCNW